MGWIREDTATLRCSCGAPLDLDDPTPGKVAQCPECGAWRRVPAPAARSFSSKRRRRGPRDRVIDCIAYPWTDGPGVALMVVLPPVLWLMSVPVFDMIKYLFPVDRGSFNPMALVIVPITLPLFAGFTLFFGYILLFLGRVLVASAMGEDEHPRLPVWDRLEILEGLGRWIWALVLGLGIGGLPSLIYWTRCGDIDVIDGVILFELGAVGVAYALMALAAALLHDSLLAANPVTVVRAIHAIGWDYLKPALIGSSAVGLAALLLWVVLCRIPTLTAAALGLWAFWILGLYLGMVAMRAIGLTYRRHADVLGWYRHSRPKWGVGRINTIYVNS